MLTGNLNTAHRIPNIQEPARLSALAVHGQGMANRRLHTEPIEDSAKDFIVIEAVDQPPSISVSSVTVPYTTPWFKSVARNFQILQANAMFTESCTLLALVKEPGLFREGKGVLAAVVLDLDITFLDVDVRSSVLAHRSKFD